MFSVISEAVSTRDYKRSLLSVGGKWWSLLFQFVSTVANKSRVDNTISPYIRKRPSYGVTFPISTFR